MTKEPTNYGWMALFVVFLFILVIATAVVIAVSVSQQSSNLPQEIDVIIVDRDRGLAQPQVNAINSNMAFRRNIYILGPHATGAADADFPNVTNVFYVNFVPVDPVSPTVLDEYFLAVQSIAGVANHAVFLADQTVPFRWIDKAYMFYGTRPRMFNIFRDTAETTFLAPYFNYTCPALVEDVSIFARLPDPPTVQNFVLFEISQARVTLRNDFNRDIFVNADNTQLIANYNQQFSELVNNTPLFATFHVTGTDQTFANAALAVFLSAQFVS